ncbi:MAG: hypothetical protein QY321_00115 [Patescibacteria group bacterium]|nr:MAG: hypothetical protein QY321_04370 [Patescibacteria group bacterium]WKZ24830.1 MAG: hypothetical protein QY321_00115 [Patescibacteria group bacterium]
MFEKEIKEFPNKHEEFFGEMKKNFNDSTILESLQEDCLKDEVLEELFEEVKEKSFQYIKDVCEMIEYEETMDGSRESSEELAEKDRARTILHNSLISTINPFYRQLNEKGKESANLIKSFVGDNRIAYRVLAMELVYSMVLNKLNNKNNQTK